MKLLYCFALIAMSQFSYSQEESEFRSPLGIPLVLSGTFAELRGNHFHGGIDIKTNGKTGYRVYSTKEGFISRIKVQAGGYGNAVYIEHPNGFTTVYGHLLEFNEEITKYIKSQQYAKESFEVDLYFTPSQFPVSNGEVIGLSGNSGSSGGPHLHYEIRKTNGQLPINPLVYTKVKDDINPTIFAVKVTDLTNGFYQNKGVIHDANYISAGNYKVLSDISTKSNVVGISIKAFDKLNGANNSNGYHSLKLFVDDLLNYEYEKDAVSFDESRMINAHVDYPEKKRGGGTFVNCFKLKGNRLNFLNNAGDGRVWLNQYPERKIRIEICDFEGNVSKIEFNLKNTGIQVMEPINSKHFFSYNQSNYIVESGIQVSLPAGAIYDDLSVNFKVEDNKTTTYPAYSKFYSVATEEIPLQQFMHVEVEATKIPQELKEKAVMANMDKRGRIDANTGEWIGNKLKIRTRNFGTYFITVDTEAPRINSYRTPAGNNYAAQSTMEYKITDNLSGISSYRATVDGQWILMNYDRKTNRLIHEFDGRVAKGEHQLEITVTDAVGNSTTETATFTR